MTRTADVTARAQVIVLLAFLPLFVFGTTFLWPGQAKLTAPLLCPDDHPDPFVVAEDFEVDPDHRRAPSSDDTSVRFSLWCVGPRGEATEVGWLRPFAVLTVAWGAIALVGRHGARVVRRRRSPTEPVEPEASPVSG